MDYLIASETGCDKKSSIFSLISDLESSPSYKGVNMMYRSDPDRACMVRLEGEFGEVVYVDDGLNVYKYSISVKIDSWKDPQFWIIRELDVLVIAPVMDGIEVICLESGKKIESIPSIFDGNLSRVWLVWCECGSGVVNILASVYKRYLNETNFMILSFNNEWKLVREWRYDYVYDPFLSLDDTVIYDLSPQGTISPTLYINEEYHTFDMANMRVKVDKVKRRSWKSEWIDKAPIKDLWTDFDDTFLDVPSRQLLFLVKKYRPYESDRMEIVQRIENLVKKRDMMVFEREVML